MVYLPSGLVLEDFAYLICGQNNMSIQKAIKMFVYTCMHVQQIDTMYYTMLILLPSFNLGFMLSAISLYPFLRRSCCNFSTEICVSPEKTSSGLNPTVMRTTLTGVSSCDSWSTVVRD